MSVPPWIPGANSWLQALQAGAQLGIHRAQIAQQGAESAARLLMAQQQMQQNAMEHRAKMGLSWAQLGADRDLAMARLNQTAAQQMAMMDLRESQLESLNAYRQLEARNAQDRLANQSLYQDLGIQMKERAMDDANARAADSNTLREWIATQQLEKADDRVKSADARAAATLKFHNISTALKDLEFQDREDNFGQTLLMKKKTEVKPEQQDAWQQASDRRAQMKSLREQLMGVGKDAGLDMSAMNTTPPVGVSPGGYVRDPGTGKLVLKGSKPAAAPERAPGGINAAAVLQPGFGVTSWFGQPQPAPKKPSVIDTFTPDAQETLGWADQAAAAYR